jgi:hypothetical protein
MVSAPTLVPAEAPSPDYRTGKRPGHRTLPLGSVSPVSGLESFTGHCPDVRPMSGLSGLSSEPCLVNSKVQ